MTSIFKIAAVILFLAIALDLILKFNKMRGHFVHPTAHKGERLAEIAHMIKYELSGLYRHSGLVEPIIAKIGGAVYRTSTQIGGPGISPASLQFSFGGVFLPFVWHYRLNDKENVARGNFGNVFVNKHFFSLRTNHHRYAIQIASELFFLQVYALSGHDPKAVQSNHSFLKKGGDIVLAKTGKLAQVAAMNEGTILTLTKHDKKVDDRIAAILALTGDDCRQIEDVMNGKVKTFHDIFRGKWHTAPEKERFLALMKQEVSHLRKLLELMEDKKTTDRKFMEMQRMDPGPKVIFEAFLVQWEKEMIYIRMIIDSLESICKSPEKWSFNVRLAHHWIRIRHNSFGDAANNLHLESGKEVIDTNKVHAIMTSFTSERGKILQMMHKEEEAA
jgi:hypothetical protein